MALIVAPVASDRRVCERRLMLLSALIMYVPFGTTMVPPDDGSASMAAWKAAVSSITPLPDAPKCVTLSTVEPIDTLGVCVHQVPAHAGCATADSTSDAAA